MAGPRFRAAPATTLKMVELDGITALFHRRSGQTHLIAEPAPELIALLQAEPVTRDQLWQRLGERFALAADERAALDERLSELVEAGLVEQL